MGTKVNSVLFALVLTGLLSCQTDQPEPATSLKPGMFKVTILYPSGEGKSFDMDYYENKHMPLVAGFLGKNLRFYEIDKGMAGRTANEGAPYVAVGYFFIDDVAEYNKAIAQNRDIVVNDIKNYTNIQPVIQISEIKRVGFPESK